MRYVPLALTLLLSALPAAALVITPDRSKPPYVSVIALKPDAPIALQKLAAAQDTWNELLDYERSHPLPIEIVEVQYRFSRRIMDADIANDPTHADAARQAHTDRMHDLNRRVEARKDIDADRTAIMATRYYMSEGNIDPKKQVAIAEDALLAASQKQLVEKASAEFSELLHARSLHLMQAQTTAATDQAGRDAAAGEYVKSMENLFCRSQNVAGLDIDGHSWAAGYFVGQAKKNAAFMADKIVGMWKYLDQRLLTDKVTPSFAELVYSWSQRRLELETAAAKDAPARRTAAQDHLARMQALQKAADRQDSAPAKAAAAYYLADAQQTLNSP